MTSPKNKMYLLMLALLILGSMPFLFVDYTYAFEVFKNPLQLLGVILGSIIWPSAIIVLLYFLINKRNKTLPSILAFLYVSFLLLLHQALIFGIYGAEMKFLGFGVLFIILFCLLRDQEIRSLFSISEKELKSEKVLIIIGLITIILIPAFYCFMIVPKILNNRSIVSTPQKINLEIGQDFDRNKYSIEKVFGWNISVPKNVNIKKEYLDKKEDSDKHVIFRNEDGSIAILIYKNNPLLNKEWTNFGRLLGFKTDYEWVKKMNYETIGIIFLVLKTLSANKNGVYDFNIGTLKGFMNKGTNLEKSITVYNYLLFDKNDNAINFGFVIKSNQLSEDQINQIVANTTKIDK